MPIKITNIKIQAFRGITDLELDLNGKSLLIRGENGSGKSSIIDALEFFFTGKVAHLDGVRGLSLQNHGTHINFNHKDLNVGITFNPGNIYLNRTLSSSISIPADFNSFFEITKKGTFILRRSQLLDFIMSQPADRFRAIGNIIGIEHLDEIELEMKRLRDQLKGEVESRDRQIETLHQELSGIIGENIDKIDSIMPILNKMLADSELPAIKSIAEADQHAEEMLKSIKKSNKPDKIRIVNELFELTKSAYPSDHMYTEVIDVNKKLINMLKNNTDYSLQKLLELGIDIINREQIEICPLCENRIERETLVARIRNRLEILNGLSSEASEIRTQSTAVLDELGKILDRIKTVTAKVDQLEEMRDQKGKIEEIRHQFESITRNVISARELNEEINTNCLYDAIRNLDTHSALISEKCNELSNCLDLTADEKKVLHIANIIQQTSIKCQSIEKITQEYILFNKYYAYSECLYTKFSEVKKSKIQEIYDSIQIDIQKFYLILHQNDPHKNIEITIAQGRRASTEISIESFGRRGEDPRALTSEGHLDSLGLCIFLAFVKRFNVNNPIIVLDDVVTTIDSKHREHICRLLLEEFSSSQLILTTHDEVWYEQLRASQRAFKKENNFLNLVITRWQIDSGPSVRPYTVRWEKIQEKIRLSDKNGAGNEGRRYLEWILERICEITKAPVPFKSSREYDIGDLFGPAKKRVTDLIIDPTFKEEAIKAFQNIERTQIMGSINSHNNTLVSRQTCNVG